MDQAKVEKFWQAVVQKGHALDTLLAVLPGEFNAGEALVLTCDIEELMGSAVPNIDPLLSAELEQGYGDGGRVLMIVITCNHNPAGIEAVQKLVATAPELPPYLQVCAFKPPLSQERACKLEFRGALGTNIPVQQVRFLALPGNATAATFDIVCIVPPSCKTDMDPEKVPGAAAAYTVLSMSIGELRMMTRINSIKVAVMDQPPAEAVCAWDLMEIIDKAPMQ